MATAAIACKPLSDLLIYVCFSGKYTVGVYPLLEDNICHVPAVDFDEAEWRDHGRAFMQSCPEQRVPAAPDFPVRQGRTRLGVFAGNPRCWSSMLATGSQ